MKSFSYVIAAIGLTGSLVVAGCGSGGIQGPGLNSVKVTITSPTSSQTVKTGGTVDLTASVTNAKADPGVVWTVSGAGTGSGVLTNPSLTSVTYNAPVMVAANTNVVVTATSVANPSVSASLAITVTGSSTNNNPLLTGQYAFLVSGNNSAIVASITADGNGNITGGEEDIFAPTETGYVTSDAYSSKTSLYSQIAITGGSYFVGDDNRGTLSYTDASKNSFTFALALGKTVSGVATNGKMTQSDTNPFEMTGSLALQQSAAFAFPQGPQQYAFGFPGWDGSQESMATAGSFLLVTLSQPGCPGGFVPFGEFDQNDNGTLNSDDQISSGNGSTCLSGISTVDSNGRATLTLTDLAGNASTYFVYIVSNDKWFAVGPAAYGSSSSGVSYGEIRQQQYGYSAASLNGNEILANQSSTSAGAPDATLGILNFDGNSNVAYSTDQNAGGGADVPGTGTTTYSFEGSPFGRFTINGIGVGYMYGNGRAFIVDENQPTPSIVNQNPAPPMEVGFGTLEPQWNLSYTNTTLQGSFFFGTKALVSAPAPSVNYQFPPVVIYNSGVLTLAPDTTDATGGSIAGTLDANTSGILTSGVSLSDTYIVAPNGVVATGSKSEIIYIVSPDRFYYLTFPSGSAGNPTIGVAEGEQLPPI